MAEVKIVLGAAFGDEGKGATVQWLCKKAIEEGKRPIVIRFTGGPQSGHTVKHNGITHVCSSFGSGVLLGTPTIYQGTAAVDPICIMNEYKDLTSKGIIPRIDVNDASIITPYDVEFSRSDPKTLSDGTCGKGVYATIYRENLTQRYFTILDDPKEILNSVVEHYNREHNSEYDNQFISAFNEVLKLKETFNIEKNDVYIYEGTQGLLLDAERGFVPHVTATSTGLKYFSESDLRNAEIYLVTRSYLTRHGNGYIPECNDLIQYNKGIETNVLNEYQGEFKVGILNIDLLNRAFDRHCLDNYKESKFNLVVTHIDDLHYGPFHYILNDQKHVIGGGIFNYCSKELLLNSIIMGIRMDFKAVYYSDNPDSNISLYMSE